MARTRILIGDTSVLNTGNAAILLGTLRALRAAFGNNVEFDVADTHPAAARSHYPEIRFVPTLHDCVATHFGATGLRYQIGAFALIAAAAAWRLAPSFAVKSVLPARLHGVLERYAAADIVIAGGGSHLLPHRQSAPSLLNYMVCRALGKPLAISSQSMGPFRERGMRILSRLILKRCAVILLRDDVSRRHLQTLGIPLGRISLSPDAAFALAPANGGTAPPHSCAERPRVAISLRDWAHPEAGSLACMERYIDAIAGLVRALAERHEAHVTFLSTCQGSKEFSPDDSVIADRVTSRLAPHVLRHVEVDRMHRRPENLIRRLKDFDLVVASRTHAAILSLCAGRPVVAIASTFRTRELLRRIGLGSLVIDTEEVSCERLLSAVSQLLETRCVMPEAVRRRVAAERRAALAAGNLVLQAVRAAGVSVWYAR